MTDIAVFDVLGQNWRCGKDERGVYTVASDAADTLDYRDATACLKVVDDDEKGLVKVQSWVRDQCIDAGGEYRTRKQWVIYEEGIWELIFRSTKPEAKAIKKRVKAILREIRTDGGYIAPSMPEALRVRFDEKFSYSKLKDFVVHASDYDPKSEASRRTFQRLQDLMYGKFVGLDAQGIKAVREINMSLLTSTRKDGQPYARDKRVAKNYLTDVELKRINHAALGAIGMLGLRMEDFNGVYTMKDVQDTLCKVLDSV